MKQKSFPESRKNDMIVKIALPHRAMDFDQMGFEQVEANWQDVESIDQFVYLGNAGTEPNVAWCINSVICLRCLV